MNNVNETAQSFYTPFMLMEALCKPKCFCLLSKRPIIILINLYIHEYYVRGSITFNYAILYHKIHIALWLQIVANKHSFIHSLPFSKAMDPFNFFLFNPLSDDKNIFTLKVLSFKTNFWYDLSNIHVVILPKGNNIVLYKVGVIMEYLKSIRQQISLRIWQHLHERCGSNF